jgi:aspartate carbamoyltransferase regulatory subunit
MVNSWKITNQVKLKEKEVEESKSVSVKPTMDISIIQDKKVREIFVVSLADTVRIMLFSTNTILLASR